MSSSSEWTTSSTRLTEEDVKKIEEIIIKHLAKHPKKPEHTCGGKGSRACDRCIEDQSCGDF